MTSAEPDDAAHLGTPLPVVVGSGLAGLVAARELAALGIGCRLITPGPLADGSASRLAQGGFAAAVGVDDSVQCHAEDTWRAGDRAGDRTAIDRITAAAPQALTDLVDLGVPFDRRVIDPDAPHDRGHIDPNAPATQQETHPDVPINAVAGLDLALEAGHSRHRIAHVADRSGAAITASLVTAVAEDALIEVIDARLVGLSQVDGPGSAVTGVQIRRDAGRQPSTPLTSTRSSAEGPVEEIPASAVILATGGYGALFTHATSPTDAVGTGIAVAARAGARTDDLHLVQFHPTALAVGSGQVPLLTEALRGAGAVLLANGSETCGHPAAAPGEPAAALGDPVAAAGEADQAEGGHRFVDELQPRDVVAAAVWEQLQAGHAVHLDAREVAEVRERFPQVTELCRRAGLDPATEPLPVRPAAHYSMGGITVDPASRSSLPGLWAVGETARTGLHGASRLASNSLLEAFVTGQAAARDVQRWHGAQPNPTDQSTPPSQHDRTTAGRPGWPAAVPAADPMTVIPRGPGEPMDLSQIRLTLTDGCGVLRDADGITFALTTLAPAVAANDQAYVAWLVARAALAHRHSRGAHRRIDPAVSLSAVPISSEAHA